MHIGLSQKSVASIFGISRNYLSMIEHGKRKCPEDLYEELVAYYNEMNQTEGLQALFDYVRVRIPTNDVQKVIEDILLMDFHEFYSQPCGLFGYIESYEYDSIRVLQSKKGDERGVLIELSGRGCRNYEYVLNELDHKWLNFFARCLAVGGVVRRIDIAIDDYVEYFTIDEVIRKRKNKEILTSFCKSKVIDASDDENEVSEGKTVYFGSRNSLVYFCFYQKNYELARKEKCPVEEIEVKNRYEIRMQKEKAQAFIDYYLESTWLLDSARSVLYQQLTFLEKNKHGVEHEWKKWTRFIGATTYVDLSMNPEKPSFDRKYRWLKNYCAQTLKIMELAGIELKKDFIQELLEGVELNDRNQKVLNWELLDKLDILSHNGRLIRKETGEIIR